MIFYNDTQPTEMRRLARHLVLATLLAAPLPSYATLQTPRRPATIEAAQSTLTTRQVVVRRNSHTYLAMVGPAALSFADAALPLPPEPVMPELPKPKTAEPTKTRPASNANTSLPADNGTKPVAEQPEQPTAEPNNNGSKPVSILPDDTRREIRPEDVLPYFQFPGSAGNDTAPTVIINPAPTSVPPSSATYRQQ